MHGKSCGQSGDGVRRCEKCLTILCNNPLNLAKTRKCSASRVHWFDILRYLNCCTAGECSCKILINSLSNSWRNLTLTYVPVMLHWLWTPTESNDQMSGKTTTLPDVKMRLMPPPIWIECAWIWATKILMIMMSPKKRRGWERLGIKSWLPDDWVCRKLGVGTVLLGVLVPAAVLVGEEGGRGTALVVAGLGP